MAVTLNSKNVQNEILYNRRNSFFSKDIMGCLDAKSGENILYLGLKESQVPISMNSYETIHEKRDSRLFDGAVSPLGSHEAGNLPQVLKDVYQSLKPGGHFVSEWVDNGSVESFLQENKGLNTKNHRFTGLDVADYWTFTREAGFEAIFVTQLTISNKQRAMDLWLGASDYPFSDKGKGPWTINRLIAVKAE